MSTGCSPKPGSRSEVRRLMTIPGVGPVTALSIVGLVGDVGRFPSSGQLVGYIGLDPRVRQSGDRPKRTGHISRQGQAHARWVFVEAAHAAVRTPEITVPGEAKRRVLERRLLEAAQAT